MGSPGVTGQDVQGVHRIPGAEPSRRSCVDALTISPVPGS
jgi:hypothetical protein